jgi:hypothetical protein
MTQIVQLDYNDLQTAIKNCLRDSIEEIKKIPNRDPLPDRIGLDEACIELGTKEKPASKAQVYKLTMLNEIPHQKFGKRLIFSRKELKIWMDQRTTTKQNTEEAAISHLQKEANKRK